MASPSRRAEAESPRPMQIDFPGLEIGAADTVVDVGCGEGVVCAYAGRRGAEVIGLDADPDALARAEAAMRGVPSRSWRGILSNCDPIPLPDGVASVVVCTEVLEHVADPVRLAAELARIGRPGARYLISVPDPASESLMRIVAPGWYWEPPYHRRVFEHDELDRLLSAAGLEVMRRESSGAYWSLWWAFRMALGAKPYEPTPAAPLLEHWDATWAELRRTPRGGQLIEELDRLVPRSQVRLARKPGSSPRPLGAGGPIAWSRSSWRRRLRDGAVRLGGLDIRWKVRRVSATGSDRA
jgi:SAM-dependent methyltransferase